MSKKLEKEYQIGYELGINLIDELGVLTKEHPNQNHMAGVLSSILNFAYYFSPSDQAVDKLIEFSRDNAKDNLEKDYAIKK